MENVLLRKLEAFGPLSADDRRLLSAAVGRPRPLPADHDIVREGDATRDVHLITEGVACRYKLVKDGSLPLVHWQPSRVGPAARLGPPGTPWR